MLKYSISNEDPEEDVMILQEQFEISFEFVNIDHFPTAAEPTFTLSRITVSSSTFAVSSCGQSKILSLITE